MGVLDVLRVPVRACTGGQIAGPALGVLAAASERCAYERGVPAVRAAAGLRGQRDVVSSREEQVRGMMDALYLRLADVTGREVDEIRADVRRGRYLTADEATDYGLIQGPASA